MKMKGVKDGIEGLADFVLIIGDIIHGMHGRAASNILLDKCIEVPDKLESTFCVLLVLIDLLGCVFEVVDELWSKVALVASGGVLRDFVEIACWVLFK